MNAALAIPATATVTVAVESNPGPDWDAFVRVRPAASVYLLSGWALLARDVFGHRAYFIEARGESRELLGVLPLVLQKSLVFGRFMTSLPFFNYGGALADSAEVALALMERARDLARELACRYLELRDTVERPGTWRVRRDKASMIL